MTTRLDALPELSAHPSRRRRRGRSDERAFESSDAPVRVDGGQFNLALVPFDTLIPLLRCTRCDGDLELDRNSLRCIGCRARYDIIGDRPVFAPPRDGRGTVQPLVYDLAQRMLGGGRSIGRI